MTNLMSTFYCFQKHDDILKFGSNKYIILYYTQNNLYSKIIKNQTFIKQIPGSDSGPGIRARIPGLESGM
jgi:hypothetical protein